VSSHKNTRTKWGATVASISVRDIMKSGIMFLRLQHHSFD
jgi:hypothetical protein